MQSAYAVTPEAWLPERKDRAGQRSSQSGRNPTWDLEKRTPVEAELERKLKKKPELKKIS
jgi:hypothetical protein